MKIALGSDHRGLGLKKAIGTMLEEMGYSYQDFGAYTEDSVDYPDIAREVGEAVAGGACSYGILICGTGIGMSMAANKVRGIRAALCHDLLDGERARAHNDANVLCLRGEVGEYGDTLEIAKTFLTASFDGGRHQRRLDKMQAMEKC